ncbi:MAG: hypothetical protein IJW45_05910, partial [Oscillospiraceae bacterium]|nr:hypothetical protein [Oscillospiraceae bacterium]
MDWRKMKQGRFLRFWLCVVLVAALVVGLFGPGAAFHEDRPDAHWDQIQDPTMMEVGEGADPGGTQEDPSLNGGTTGPTEPEETEPEETEPEETEPEETEPEETEPEETEPEETEPEETEPEETEP